MPLRELTIAALKQEARAFAQAESAHDEPALYGVTDGKAVGTYFEHKFRSHLRAKYGYREGSSAEGIDFPQLLVDMKVTSVRQPQSSCPYESARQKIFGLGYSLLIFAYEKHDDDAKATGRLDIRYLVLVDAEVTADFQTTKGIADILHRDGNKDDLVAFMADRMLPVDEIEAANIADEILASPPAIGYLTISNALQWRLQYRRAIDMADTATGISRLR